MAENFLKWVNIFPKFVRIKNIWFFFFKIFVFYIVGSFFPPESKAKTKTKTKKGLYWPYLEGSSTHK